MNILTVKQMQTLEKKANDGGLTYTMMMHRAGTGLAKVIKSQVSKDDEILLLIGPGNNGGDGLVAARLLHQQGYQVTTYLSRFRDAETDKEFVQALDSGVSLLFAEKDNDYAILTSCLDTAGIIVDALLGTGSKPPVKGMIADILRIVKAVFNRNSHHIQFVVAQSVQKMTQKPKIIAVDGPSGLDFDTGEVDEYTLHADITVTFASPKWGQLKRPGANYIGELIVVDIGTDKYSSKESIQTLASANMISSWLPSRPADAHKGTFGRSMIVAGSINYTGAAILSAMGAHRTGAGLVTLAIPANLHSAVVSAIPEATYLLLPHTMGIVNEQAVPILKEHLRGYNVLLIGPGLGNTVESQRFIQTLLTPVDQTRRTGFVPIETSSISESQSLPQLIIDADGLNILSGIPNWHQILPAYTILTPHPGEMSRLTDLSTAEINADRYHIAARWAQIWNHIVLLKGANTVIAHPEGKSIILPFSNPGLSTAGTGDVLAGAIASMVSQGLEPFEAAVTGAFLHGIAGEICRKKIGTAGIVASDVAQALASALHRFE